MNEQTTNENPKYICVPASKIHCSSILPKREHGEAIAASVKETGILQPLIARPIANRPGEYELIDGQGRLEPLQSDRIVPLQVVEATDLEAFKISNATFQRKDLSAYEKAEFYEKWRQTIASAKGTEEGAQAKLAKQAGCSESLVSQYLAIHQLFKKVKDLDPAFEFSALKLWDLNRLYELSKLTENPNLIETALELERKPDTSLDELKMKIQTIERQQTLDSMREIEESLNLLKGDSTSSQGISRETHRTYSKAAQKKLVNLVFQTTRNLNETHTKLNSIMDRLESDSGKYVSNDVLKTVKRILTQLTRLRLNAEALDRITFQTQ